MFTKCFFYSLSYVATVTARALAPFKATTTLETNGTTHRQRHTVNKIKKSLLGQDCEFLFRSFKCVSSFVEIWSFEFNNRTTRVKCIHSDVMLWWTCVCEFRDLYKNRTKTHSHATQKTNAKTRHQFRCRESRMILKRAQPNYKIARQFPIQNAVFSSVCVCLRWCVNIFRSKW